MVDGINSAYKVHTDAALVQNTKNNTIPAKSAAAPNCNMNGLKALASYNQSFLGKNIKRSTKIYSATEKAQESFTQEGLTFETKPSEIAEYMRKNNIQHEIKYTGEENNNRSIIINEYDSDGSKSKVYHWYYGKNNFNEHASIVSVSEFDKSGNEVKQTAFSETETHVSEYFYKG